ncbi:MAG: hypothetical protein WAK24_06745 [Candidatus Acidiferrales bacterium]
MLDRLVSATSERAILKSALEIPTKTIVSTVPSAIAPVLQQLDCPKDKGRLQVNRKLELAGYEGQVWALGDCASIVTKSGNPVPPTAQHATREAATVAGNIAACLRGKESCEFDLEGLGKLGSSSDWLQAEAERASDIGTLRRDLHTTFALADTRTVRLR